ncbi:MAG: M3 family oligoendopeptidase, partial [Candidatus Marinimicrobia bacterium]|nr:M3 family oligoendopeptidase [Candidatus Neomarinimicrobiota bacterium]
MKYTDYYYERIDIEAFRVNMESWRKEFNEADSVEVQSNIIQKVDEFEREYASYQAIASLNYNRNINDEDAKSEKEYFDSIGPQASEISNGFNQDLVDSKFRKELEEKWGPQYFSQIELDLKTFDPSIMDMLLEETKLRNEYTQLIASAQIEYNGETYNLAGLGPFHKDSDREVRKSSYEARFNWFQDNSEAFDTLYDKLVKLRHKIALTLGYESFTELGYMRMGRSDYGPDEVANFRQQIVDYVVPIVAKLREQRQEILGLDHLYFYDGINYKEGDPKPKGTPEDLVNKAVKMYDELSPETGEFFHKMVDEDLMDLVNRDGKMAGGFCTGFPKYERPYIFSNFNGTD